MKKIHFIYGAFWVITLTLVALFFQTPVSQQPNEMADSGVLLKGQVIERHDNVVYVKLISGPRQTVKTELNDLFFHDDYKKGDKVSLYVTEMEDGRLRYDIQDYYHKDGLLAVFVLFGVLAVLIAGKKGIFSILSVMLSLFLFYAIILNAVKAGFPLLPAGLIYIFLITVLTIPLIHGFNRKSLSSLIAVNAGYAAGFLFTYFFAAAAHIGNTPSEEFRTLLSQFPDTDIRQVLILSLFLGAAGALIDVAVTICSAVFEGLKENPGLSFTKTYRLGMEVGKDILGSMINTLLLAYLAASLPFLTLMAMARFNDVHEFLNYDFVALELTRIFLGAFSIILLIPIASVAAAYFVAKNAKR
ncbi:YibE/F family protein [Candidatus Peregrinibacteria bacterium]|nr:YibE/F family protein [Candidatus Peregrinibacteria bacterium]